MASIAFNTGLCEQPRCTKKRAGFFIEPGTAVYWAGCKTHLARWLLDEVNGGDISRGVVNRGGTGVLMESHEGLPCIRFTVDI